MIKNKNIDDEINKLLDIRDVIKEFEYMQQHSDFTVFTMSQRKYDELCSNNEIMNDAIYYIFEPEIGQYIKGYKR